MKGLSCNSNLFGGEPIEHAIDVLAEEGYQAVDVCMELAPPFIPPPPPHLTPDIDGAARDRLRRYAEDAGIAIAALNCHNNLCSRDPERRQANADFLEGTVQLAADLGAPVVVTIAGVKDSYGYEEWFWKWGTESLRQSLPLADRLGVTIAIESASPPGCLIWNLATMQKLLGTEGLASIRTLFDPAHYYIRGDSVVGAAEALADSIAHVHAKDAAGDPENIIFPPLGEGEINFDVLFAALAAGGYSDFIAMEYEAFAWDYPREPRQVLSTSKALLDPLIDKHWTG